MLGIKLLVFLLFLNIFRLSEFPIFSIQFAFFFTLFNAVIHFIVNHRPSVNQHFLKLSQRARQIDIAFDIDININIYIDIDIDIDNGITIDINIDIYIHIDKIFEIGIDININIS